MDTLTPLIWIIVIVIWIVSALAKKQAGTTSHQEGPPPEEGVYRKPEEAIERFLRRLSGDEEIKIIPSESTVEKAVSPPPLREEMVAPSQIEEVEEEPVREAEPEPRRKKIRRAPSPYAPDLSTIRQGIILSEILGPPRAKKPLLW